MSRIPRILPLIAVAIAGVIGINLLAGARDLPHMLSGAKAFAEGALKGGKKDDKPEAKSAETGGAPAAATLPPPACAPTAAELAKAAGLSPAELQIVQSLGERRAELDQREQGDDTNTQLLAAAEAKLDAKIAQMNALKSDIQGLLGQADAQAQAETDRLITTYSAMKPKDAAARMTLLSDAVRLPMAAKMKERTLSAILAQMAPADARDLTEKLAGRFAAAKAIADAKAAVAPPTAAAPTGQAAQAVQQPAAQTPATKTADATKTAPPAAKPKRVAAAKPRKVASAAPAKAGPAETLPKSGAVPAAPSAAAPAPNPAKTG